MSKKVLMAMSGGIDSSVAAILLREQGYDLIGVTFRTFDAISQACMEKEKGCCSVDSIFEAKNLAEKLGFEHHILDIRQEFREHVIQNFIDEYLQGRTPNPCVLCNSYVKWGLLLAKADALGCDFIATGHYARIENTNGRYFLRQGADLSKDQTYFLWTLTQENLSRTLFPLGALTKTEVRKIALNHGYEKLSKKKESQEICFVPDNDYRRFLKENVADIDKIHVPGNFTDTSGKILGRHCGLYNYTIGQRRGLGIALGEPVYVVALNIENNSVVLGDKNELKGRELRAEALNMMKYASVADGMRVMARIRYRSQGGAAALYNESGGIRVVFDEPVESITAGQSVVLYEGEDVVGGGIISA
ncbi:MAG: tRNA 2-thiouridine(34) synthase MnmA [Bacteroidales bacterium]|nr:tRNA 2-thiouridine(34) synthase MnmA [Bacteroidales bacterium]